MFRNKDTFKKSILPISFFYFSKQESNKTVFLSYLNYNYTFMRKDKRCLLLKLKSENERL